MATAFTQTIALYLLHVPSPQHFHPITHGLDCSAWLDRDAAVFDWSCLGIFTGSRSGEYAQTVAKRGQFACIPNSWAAATEWKGTPLAFIATDFTFYDAHMRLVKLSILLDATAQALSF